MKYRFIIIITIVIFFGRCSSQKQITYEFPSAMSESVQMEYTKLCEKGRVLYELNCAKCHTAKINGRKIIPDFSVDEIESYTIRILNPQHEDGLPEENITAEELGLVTTFLTYKKKNEAK